MPLCAKLQKHQLKTFGTSKEETLKTMNTLKMRIFQHLFLPYRTLLDTSPSLKTHEMSRSETCCYKYQNTANWDASQSRSLPDAKEKHDNTQHKCLAIDMGVCRIRPYLKVIRYVIRSDHDSSKWIFKLTDSTARLAHWCLRLSKLLSCRHKT